MSTPDDPNAPGHDSAEAARWEREAAEDDRRIQAATDWRVLADHYRPGRKARIGHRIVFEGAPHEWALGSAHAYFNDKPQRVKLEPGEHRALLVLVGLFDRFPHYVLAPTPLFVVDVNEVGATWLPDWRLQQAMGALDDHAGDGVVPLPVGEPSPLTPADLASIRRALEGDFLRTRRRMLGAALQSITLPRETIWHPGWLTP